MSTNRFTAFFTSAVLCAIGAGTAAGQAARFEDRTVQSVHGPVGDAFGGTVAIEGDRLLVSASEANSAAAQAGEVQVFRLGASIVLEGILVGGDLAAQDRFGLASAMSSGAIVVGAGSHDHGLADAGAAWVFRWTGSAWVQEAELLASDRAAADNFGGVVDIAGDRIVVSATGCDIGSAADQGAFYVFDRIGGVWTQVYKGTSSDGVAGDQLGVGLAVDGGVVVASSTWADAGYTDSGAAYVFRRVGGVWSQEVKLGPGPGSYGTFGYAVDVEGDVIACGEPYGGAGATGAVSVFRWNGSAWMQEALLAPAYGSALDTYGCSVELQGDRMTVGSFGANVWANFSGVGYVCERVGGTWMTRLELVPSTGAQYGNVGWDVAIDGQRVALSSGLAFGVGVENTVRLYDLRPPVGASFCAGDGAGSPCPCGNESAPGLGFGCLNGYNRGAQLAASGSASVAADDLVFSVVKIINNVPVLLAAADDRVNGGAGLPFGDGLRCLAGSLSRLQVRWATPLGGIAIFAPGLCATGGFAPGDTRYFQALYRDPQYTPCGSNFNTTNAVEVVFAP